MDYAENDKIIEIIQMIEKKYGEKYFSNSIECKGMLMDYMVNYPRERRLLESALEEGIVEELRKIRGKSEKTIKETLKYCGIKLEKNRGLKHLVAIYTIEIIAEGINLSIPKEFYEEYRDVNNIVRAQRKRIHIAGWILFSGSILILGIVHSIGASKIKYLNTLIEAQESALYDDNVDKTIALYEKAITGYKNNEEAYELLVDYYIGLERYDTAVEWINEVQKTVNNKHIIDASKEWKNKILLAKAYHLVENSNYKKLKDFFEKDYFNLEITDENVKERFFFFQDGKVMNTIKSGKGMVLGEYCIYYGDIQENLREGEGIQYHFYHDTENQKLYQWVRIENGHWKDDLGNGKMTFNIINWSSDSKFEYEKYIGTVVNGKFDGKFTQKIKKRKEKYTGDAYGTAKMGDIILINKTSDGDYVYAENENTQWFFFDEESLKKALVCYTLNTIKND